jgi:hypothetical protein
MKYIIFVLVSKRIQTGDNFAKYRDRVRMHMNNLFNNVGCNVRIEFSPLCYSSSAPLPFQESYRNNSFLKKRYNDSWMGVKSGRDNFSAREPQIGPNVHHTDEKLGD